MCDKLRDEIVESEKARADLLKWKLVLIAAIAAAGLGIGQDSANVVILAFLPFVCLYVDALCFHDEIRIIAIARFLRTESDIDLWRKYEEYCKNNRQHFNLETFALVITTVALSALVSVLGFSEKLQRDLELDVSPVAGSVLTYAGLIGAVAGVLFFFVFDRERKGIDGPKAGGAGGH